MTLLTATKVKHYFGGLCAVSDFNLQLHYGDLMGLLALMAPEKLRSST
jgi:branched-chain amino acid transport system ATP-binding protein